MFNAITRTTHWLAMMLVAVAVLACSDDTSPTDPTPSDDDRSITLTLNGGGLSNTVLALVDSSAVSNYTAATDITTIRFAGFLEGKAALVLVSFKGKDKSTRQLDGTVLQQGVTLQWGTEVYAAMTQGSIVITKYDDSIGGEVKGTFSGTAGGTINGNPATITVSAGSFAAKRAS